MRGVEYHINATWTRNRDDVLHGQQQSGLVVAMRQQQQLTEQLQQALESRVIIEQAKGITAQLRRVTVDQAYLLMRGHARNNNASMRAVAEAIVAVGLQV